MGRGRAKAKQVKVARELKYRGGGMDLDQLRAEIGVGTDRRDGHDADDHAAYADFASRYSVDDEDESEDEDEDDLDDYDEDDPDDDEFDEDDLDDEEFDEDDFDEDEDPADSADPRRDGARMSRTAGG